MNRNVAATRVAADSAHVYSELIRYEIRLYNALDRRLRAAHGLAATQYEALRLLDAGEARTVGELATRVGITVGAASKAVDRIEAAGWVLRSPNPRNRRSSLLELTRDGAALLARVTPTVAATLEPLIAAPLGEAGLAEFATMLARLRATVDASASAG